MNMLNLGGILVLVVASGCVTLPPCRIQDGETRPLEQVDEKKDVHNQRVFTTRQLDTLREFALSESPRLWQTIQRLKSEKATRSAALLNLCREMEVFGRDPKADPDVVALQKAVRDLDTSLNVIYQRLEDAYIAYKKMQATPGRQEYADMMKSALEGGIFEADAVAARYRDMSSAK